MTDGPTIGPTLAESTPWHPPRPRPDGAPNVIVVMLDDVGFAQLGCYGSDIDTPHIDRLAGHGLRYNRFHVTAMCSPSRAALLTGRNHHAVDSGIVKRGLGRGHHRHLGPIGRHRRRFGRAHHGELQTRHTTNQRRMKNAGSTAVANQGQAQGGVGEMGHGAIIAPNRGIEPTWMQIVGWPLQHLPPIPQ